MKASASAPSSLPSVKTYQKRSLFNDDKDDDDLFAPTEESRYLQNYCFFGVEHCKHIPAYTKIVLKLISLLYGTTLLSFCLARKSHLSSCSVTLHIVRKSLRELLSYLKMRMMMIKGLSLASKLLSTKTPQPQLLK